MIRPPRRSALWLLWHNEACDETSGSVVTRSLLHVLGHTSVPWPAAVRCRRAQRSHLRGRTGALAEAFRAEKAQLALGSASMQSRKLPLSPPPPGPGALLIIASREPAEALAGAGGPAASLPLLSGEPPEAVVGSLVRGSLDPGHKHSLPACHLSCPALGPWVARSGTERGGWLTSTGDSCILPRAPQAPRSADSRGPGGRPIAPRPPLLLSAPGLQPTFLLRPDSELRA